MKRDIYQEITDYIVSTLESVELSNLKAPFAHLSNSKPPVNPITGKCYNGINTVVLWCIQTKQERSTNEWATFKQWQEKGATVRKGEKASSVIFYKQVEKKSYGTQEDKETYNMIKYYSVFNADQVEGYEPQLTQEKGIFGRVEKIEAIESFIEKTKAIVKTGQSAAFFPISDYIEMPKAELFFDNDQSATENYYAVLLHELTHWTGGKPRLDRQKTGKNEHQDYAFEELIAELGSAFLCAQFDIKQEGREDHALYIKSWLRALKNDKKYIFKAATQAQKAVDFLNAMMET